MLSPEAIGHWLSPDRLGRSALQHRVVRGCPVWNAGLPARYPLVMGARTFALIQAIHATDDRSPDRMRQFYAAHGATLLG